MLKAKYEQDRAAAQDAAREFDRKQWRIWSRELAGRCRHVASDKPACESLILELWERAHESHRRAQRNRSGAAYHRVRVERKKFRYATEDFLPCMYPGWTPDLKFLQDLLGEIHDLDVISQMISQKRTLSDEAARASWAERLKDERASRLQQYRAKMAAKASPLRTWREALPVGKEGGSPRLAGVPAWGDFITPRFTGVRRTARLALPPYDGFRDGGLIVFRPGSDGR